mgnify:FL=1|tara:strand:+ start:208 stop:1161 length:954 start_codon:yes stop_codon:yes gene_type:complete
MKNNKILITGSSGFIGFHVVENLLKNNYQIVGIDNHNNYYDPKIKNGRKKILNKYKNFKFFKVDIKNKDRLLKIFKNYRPHVTINLAAQAGVRYSFKNPQKYIDSNITGFTNILEIMKFLNLKNLIYASSSSVYGDSKKFPFKENQNLNPLNFYGQTKLMNEKIANIYKKNFNINTIGLRFFTIYGPYGRPDMFIPKIFDRIKNGKSIDLFNNGNHFRDFTFVGDVSNIILKMIKKIDNKKLSNIYNICNGRSYNIKKIIKLIEKETNLKLKIKNKPFQMGDMFKTFGDSSRLKKNYKIKKFTSFEKGIKYTLQKDF